METKTDSGNPGARPSSSPDVLQARRFLRALCDATTGDREPVIVFQCSDDAKLDRPGLTEHKAGTLTSLLGYLRAQNNRGAAIFFQVNTGGRGDTHIIEPRALLIDDDLKATTRPDLSKLPPSAIVRSSLTPDGPKMHYYWFLRHNESLEAWLPAMQHLAKHFGTDLSVCKLSQVMRLPGFLHRKGKPQRTELLECHPTRRFTIDEVTAAFLSSPPSNKNGTNGIHHHGANGTTAKTTADKYARIDAALAGELPPPEPGTDGRDADDIPHTEKSRETFQRVCEWLSRIGEPYTTKVYKPRFIFLTKGCPRNREHKDAVIIAGTRGGIIAKCFHDSCGNNKQSWLDFKTILGGWSELKRGDHVELMIKLRNDLRAECKSDLVCESRFKYAIVYRYVAETGTWTELPDEAIIDKITTYAGLSYGAKGTMKKLNNADVNGILYMLKGKCSQPAFFLKAPTGALFANGFLTIDGKKLVLHPHSSDHRARAAYPFTYEPATDAPRWLQYLREVFEKDADAEQKITFLQEFFGACFLGIATRYQLSLFLTGGGENGKSVALKILGALFPPVLRAAIRPQDMDDDYKRAELYGKRINIVSETPEREILNTSGFKAMVDGSLINARPIREAPISFEPTAAHVFACNTLPATTDFSEGFWRRISIITYNRRFLMHEKDEFLADKIIDNELAGVCNWCLLGAQRLLERGHYVEPPSSAEARNLWRWQANPVARFVEEETETCDFLMGATTEQLYQAYRLWTEENGHKQSSKIAFAMRLEGLRVPNDRKKREGKVRTVWQLRLSNNYAQLEM